MAGDGDPGTSGDGGPATKAELFGGEVTFATVAIDNSGNLYLADTGNDVIREVHAGSRTITKVVGTGDNHFGGDGGPATRAALPDPLGMALDGAGNLFLADGDSGRVREIHAGSGVITTVAGTSRQGFSGDGGPATKASLNHPVAVAIDGAGNQYIADYDNGRVRMVRNLAVPVRS